MSWEWVDGYDNSTYTDDMIFEVDYATKKVQKITGQTLISGENRSQFIRFVMDRYYDGVDLSTKNIQIIYLTEDEYSDINSAVCVERSDDQIRFGWLVPAGACYNVGITTFSIEFVGDEYTLKTQAYDLEVLDGLNGGVIVPEPTDKAWYIELQERCDYVLNTATDAKDSAAESAANAASSETNAAESETNAQAYADLARGAAYGSPLTANTVSAMTDNTRVYVYTGSESGYTAGHWYYWNGSAWTDGGVYNSVAVDTDETLTVLGKPADAKVTGDRLRTAEGDIADLKEDLSDYTNTQQKPNLFNNSDIIDGYYYARTGVLVESSAWAYSPTYSEVTGDETYYARFFRAGVWSKALVAIVWYDSTKNFISQMYDQDSYTAPANAKYVRISVRKETIASLVFANFQATSPQEYGYDYSLRDHVNVPTLDEMTTIVQTQEEDVPPTEITIHDGYFMGMTGTEQGPFPGVWAYGEYTISEMPDTITVSGMAGQLARLWVIKDSDSNVIGCSDYSGTPIEFSETITMSNYPSASKLFVNNKAPGTIKMSRARTEKVIDGEKVYIDDRNLHDALDDVSNTGNVLWNKILCCVGDSITYGADMDAEGIAATSDITVYQSNSSGNFNEVITNFLKSWGYLIAERNNMIFYNGGVSGSTMQGLTDKNGFSLANGRYTKLPDNIDYLVIWFGWNDTAYGTLGAITDTENTSYYGGYNVVLPYLIDKYPYAKIALIVPFGTDAGHRNAIRQLGDKWGVAVWDNYQGGTPLYYGKEDSVGVEQSVVTANRAKFQANGAHPNHRGHKQLADMIEEFLRGI